MKGMNFRRSIVEVYSCEIPSPCSMLLTQTQYPFTAFTRNPIVFGNFLGVDTFLFNLFSQHNFFLNYQELVIATEILREIQ